MGLTHFFNERKAIVAKSQLKAKSSFRSIKARSQRISPSLLPFGTDLLHVAGVSGFQQATYWLVEDLPMPHTSSGTNGALAAAITASTQAMASQRLLDGHSTTAYQSSPNTLPHHKELQETMHRTGRDTLRLPKDREINRSRSPSDIAAKLAAARHAPQTQQILVATTIGTDRQQSRDLLLMKDLEAPTDTTSIAPTDVLVNIFERKSRARPCEALTTSTISTTKHDILSPKPLRAPVEGNVRLKGADTTGKQRRSTQTDGYTSPQMANDARVAHQVSAQAVMPTRSLDPSTLALRDPKIDATANHWEAPSRRNSQIPSRPSSSARVSYINVRKSSYDSFRVESIAPTPRVGQNPPLPPTRRSSRLSQISLRETPDAVLDLSASRSSNNTLPTGTRNFGESDSQPTRGPTSEQGSTLEAQHARSNGEKWRQRPSSTAASHLTEDSLANAIVASSLACSRAPSPTKFNILPLPARHVKPQKALYYQQRHESSLSSRTPSPAKGMRHTMRRTPSSDDEPSKTSGVHQHGRRNLLKKHPNKHHEGDRKRWRDEVNERERKLYEGVWAANKGFDIADPSMNSAFDQNRSATAGSSMVLNVVVREIWLRSRLSDGVLAEIWDLVNNQSTGMLSREEFVVGMWLIDQRLKGRKLPVKISDTIWASVRQLSGIKL